MSRHINHLAAMLSSLIAVFVVVTMATAQTAQAVGSASSKPTTQAEMVINPMGRPLVQVFAFIPIGDVGHDDWVGRGIQENLQTDISRTGALPVVAPQSPVPGADHIALAKQNGANLAVIGSYQIVSDQMRVNGHLIDTATGNTVGSFSATGPERDLFKIEDALGEQLCRLLPLPVASSQTTPTYVNPWPYQQEPLPPVVTYPPPETINNYYNTTAAVTPYYYPDSFYPTYYAYDNPFAWGFYGGIGIIAGDGFHDRDFGHRGHEHHDFDGGHSHDFAHGLRPNPTFHNPVYNGGFRNNGARSVATPVFRGSGSGGFHGGSGHGGGR